MVGMYVVYYGLEGFRYIVNKVYYVVVVFLEGLKILGYELINDMFFDIVVVKVDMIKVKVILE